MSIGSSPFQGGGSASIADATESTAGKIRISTTSESTTGTNDTTAMTPAKVKARIDAALVGGVEYKGSYTGQSLVTAEKGDLYVSAATYSLAGVQVLNGDHIIFNQDAADPVTSTMFDKIDNTDQVSSVNTETGAVVLSGANLDGDHSPSNYSATTDKIEKHLEGIDTALGARQPLDAQLTDVAGLTPTNNHVIVGDNSNFTAAQLASTQLSDSTDLARLASPALTGTPSAPTATSGTNTTQLATTAFVQSAVSSAGGNQITDIEEKSGSTFTAEANHIYICAYNAGTQAITFPDASSSSTGDIIGLSTFLATRSVSIVSSDGTTNDIKNNSNQTKGGTNGALSLNIHRQISWFVSDGALWLEANAALSTVATTGVYSDLSGTPTLGTASANATTDFLQVTNNLSDLNNAGTARTNLGLVIGSDVQAHDAGLDSISGLTTAADKMIYTTGSDTYAVTDLTSAGRALLDDADAAAQQATLGLGTAATKDVGTSANNVVQLDGSSRLPAVDGSQLTGITATDSTKLAIANNLSDLNNTGTARTNLGLAIGSDVQAHDAGLDSISGLTTAADKMIYTTGSDTYAVASLTAAGRALLDDADAAAQQATLGLGTAATKDVGTSANNVVQLDGSSRLPAVDGSQLTGITATDSTKLAIANNLSDLNNAGTARTNLGLAIGSDVQAHDAGLDSISGLTTAADKMLYTTGSDTYAVTDLTSAGRALLDDADAAAQRTTLGLVIGTDVLSDVVQDTTPQLGGDLDVNGQDISTTSGNANLGLKPHGTGYTELIGNTTGGNNPGALRFNCEQNTHGVIIKSPLHSDYASGGDYTLTLPTGLPASDKVLQSSSAGVLSWVAQSGGGSVPGVTNTGSVNSTPYPSSGVLSSNGIEEVYLITPAQNTVVNIPAASTAGTGYKYQIKNLSASYNLTITPASGYIDSSATSTYTTTNQFESITLISDGSNWYII